MTIASKHHAEPHWRITLNHNEIAIDDTAAVIDWLISPNHSEIAIDDTDLLIELSRVSPNHSEILID